MDKIQNQRRPLALGCGSFVSGAASAKSPTKQQTIKSKRSRSLVKWKRLATMPKGGFFSISLYNGAIGSADGFKRVHSAEPTRPRVNESVNRIDDALLTAAYPGGDGHSFHPKLLTKVILYAYTQHIYSSRQMPKPCEKPFSSCGWPVASVRNFVRFALNLPIEAYNRPK